MSTLGYQDVCGGYHEYTGGYSVHRRDTMSTPGDTMSTPGDFGMNRKRPLPNSQDFCSSTFCDYAVVYVGLWNI